MLNAGYSTLEYLKRQIFPDVMEDDVEWDEDLKRIGLSVSTQFDRFCNREFARMVDAVDDEKANLTSMVLRRYPVESMGTVQKVCEDYTLDMPDAVASYGAKSGVVEFSYKLGSYQDRIKVTYTGGYWLNDDGTMPDGATALPSDILNAFILQVQSIVKATDVLRNAVVKGDGDTMQIAALKMVPMVEQTLNSYRRYS